MSRSPGIANRRGSITVQPLEIISFWTVPGPGSEWASFGLARYPAEIEVTYYPNDDDRFTKTITKGGMTRGSSTGNGGNVGCKSNGHDRWDHPDDEKFQAATEDQDRTRLHLALFDLLQDPVRKRQRCGGIPNFIRCHLCVIHLLDRIGELPTMKVEIDDEGKYGRSYYTDDPWAEKRVYTWHEGKYDVKALVEEVGELERNDRRHVRGHQRRAQGERVIHSAGITNHQFSRLRAVGVQGAAEPPVSRPLPESDEATG